MQQNCARLCARWSAQETVIMAQKMINTSDLGAHEFSELESRAVGPIPCRTSLLDGGGIW